MKILMHYNDFDYNKERKAQNTYGALGYYRILKPSQQIEGHEVTVIGKEFMHFGNNPEEIAENIFKEYDVYWCIHFTNPQMGAALAYHAQKSGKKFVIDIDDNYLDIFENHPIYDQFKPGTGDRAMLSTILSFANAITVSTEPLKDRIYNHIRSVHGIDKPMFLIPNMNDINDWNYESAPKHEDRITIGYAASNSHQDDLVSVMPAIKEVMENNDKVWFEVAGVIPKEKLDVYFKGWSKKLLDRTALLPVTATFKEYPEYLASMKWDIGICPLVDTAFTRSKSHIKWMEFAMYKIPVVASRVYPYFMDIAKRQTIMDGETGLLAQNKKDWVKHLTSLINDKGMRNHIGHNAYEFVKDKWQYKDGPINDTIQEMLVSFTPIKSPYVEPEA